MANDGRPSKPPPFRPRPAPRESEPALVVPKGAVAPATRPAEREEEPLLPAPKAPGAASLHSLTSSSQLPALELAADQPIAAAPEAALDLTFDAPSALERLLDDPSHLLLERRAEAMLAELERATEPDEVAMLAYELGELYERWLVDEARAIKSYGRALAAEARFAPNLWAIRRLFYRRALWANLHRLIDAELATATLVERRAELLLERGAVFERQGRLSEAAEAYRASADIATQPLSPLLHLERVALPTMLPAQRIALWTELAATSTSPQRRWAYWIDITHAILGGAEAPDETLPGGATLEVSGGIRGAAAREALGYLRAHASIEDLASEPLSAAAVRLAEYAKDPPLLAEALAGRAAVLQAAIDLAIGEEPSDAANGVGTAETRAPALRLELAALRRRQAQLAHALGDHESAWESWQQALALAPGEAVLAEELALAAERCGKYAELADVMASWEAAEADPSKLLALSLRRFEALVRGGKIEQAGALLASLDPGAHPGTAALVALLREREALLVGDDLGVARAQARLAQALADEPGDPNAAAFMWTCAAETIERHAPASDGADALAWLTQALTTSPGYLPAILRALEVFMRTGALADAMAFCVQMRAHPPLAADVDSQRAYARYLCERQCELARLADDHATALELLGEIAAASAADDPVRWRYEEALALAGDDARQLAWLAGLVESEVSPLARREACLRAAQLSERLGAVRQALTWCERAIGYAEAADDTEAMVALAIDFGRRHALWQDVYRLQRNRLPALRGDAKRAALHECAWILEFQLGDPERAFREYGHLLLEAPDDAAAQGGAMRAGLAAIDLLSGAECEQLRQWAAADAVALAGWASAMSKRDPQGARSAFHAAAALASGPLADQQDPVAVRFAAQRWWMLAADSRERMTALAALAGMAAPGDVRASLQEARAWLGYTRGEDREAMAATLELALEEAVAPGLRMALGMATAFTAARGADWEEAARGWQTAAIAAYQETGLWPASIHVRAGLAVRGDRSELAERHFANARRAAPHRADIQTLAADMLDPHAIAAWHHTGVAVDDIDQLMARADLLGQRMQLASDPAAQHAWRLDRAEVLESAGRLTDALAEVQAVLRDRRADIRALEAMRRLGERAGRPELQAPAAFELAAFLRQPATRALLWRQAALLWDTAGADDEALSKAVLAYKRLVTDDPDAAEFSRLCQLLGEFGDYDELVDVLSQRVSYLRHRMHQLQQSGEPAAVREAGLISAPLADVLYQRARYYWHLEDTARALADLRQAAALAPTQPEVRMALDVAHAHQAQRVSTLAKQAADEVSGVHRVGVAQRGARAAPAQSLALRMEDTRTLLAQHPHRMALYEELLALSRLGGDLLLAARCERILRCLSGKGISATEWPAAMPPLVALMHQANVAAVTSPFTSIWQTLAPVQAHAAPVERREHHRAVGAEINLAQLATGWPQLAALVAATQRQVRVFITREHPGLCRVVDGAPISLYLSDDVARCQRGADIARCVSSLALAAAGLAAVASWVPAEVAAWVEAAALASDVSAAERHAWLDIQGVSSAIDHHHALLIDVEHQPQRALLDRAFARLGTLPSAERMSLSQWQQGIIEVGSRVALIATGDLVGVLEAVDVTTATLQDDPLARRLLPWFVSEEFSMIWRGRANEGGA